MPVLIEKKININGRWIYCKVTADSIAAAKNGEVVLWFEGGPGFHSHRELPGHTFIQFDYFGCGLSKPEPHEAPVDRKKEYTMENFTKIAIGIIEAIKEELGLEFMHVTLWGGSFGGMMALYLPKFKPEWFNKDSKIRIAGLYVFVAPTGTGKRICSEEFLEEIYAEHPKLIKYVQAAYKVKSGKIEEHDGGMDYIKNVAGALAEPMDAVPSTFMKMIANQFEYHPKLMLGILQCLNFITFHQVKMFSDAVNDLDCAVEVMNQMFRDFHSHFSAEDLFKVYFDIYSRIPICMIAEENDFCAPARFARELTACLPDTLAVISLNGMHRSHQDLKSQLFHAYLTQNIEELNHLTLRPEVIHAVIPSGFVKLLQNRDSIVALPKSKSQPLGLFAVERPDLQTDTNNSPACMR